MFVYLDGVLVAESPDWRTVTSVPVPAETQVIGIACQDFGVAYGIVGSTDSGIVTDASWTCSSENVPGWAEPGFLDNNADFSSPKEGNNFVPGGASGVPNSIAKEAKSLWGPQRNGWAYCKKYIGKIILSNKTFVELSCGCVRLFNTIS